MKIVTLDQGTAEWLEWRATGIGASETAACLGLNPYQSATDVWEKKLGRGRADAGNVHTRRGQALEPEARGLYNGLYGAAMEPVCIIHDTLDWLKASLDGIDFQKKRIIEIKCPSFKNHALHLGGDIEEYYTCQIQHQLLLTGFDRCDFISYNPKDFDRSEAFVVIPVKADKDFQHEMLEGLKRFWHCVQTGEQPTW